MNFSLDIILVPILTMIVVQAIKLATDGIKGNFNLTSILTTYGGMPSGHSAFVTSLCAMVAYREGIESVAFSVSVIFSLLVITDAMQFRKHVDQQGKAITALTKLLPQSDQSSIPTFASGLEHTFPQVVVGVLIGIAIPSLIVLL